ncbi:MAG: hypothetical protein IJL91_05765 [Bacteroidales bacterium]|nr:hypothetical protein [Bacteroidales bacterium]
MYKLITKITSFLNRFGKDRYYHFIFALVLTQLFTAVIAILGGGNWSLFCGPAMVLCLGFAKEFHDEKTGEGFEPYDVVWDFLGVFSGIVLMVLLIAGFRI